MHDANGKKSQPEDLITSAYFAKRKRPKPKRTPMLWYICGGSIAGIILFSGFLFAMGSDDKPRQKTPPISATKYQQPSSKSPVKTAKIKDDKKEESDINKEVATKDSPKKSEDPESTDQQIQKTHNQEGSTSQDISNDESSTSSNQNNDMNTVNGNNSNNSTDDNNNQSSDNQNADGNGTTDGNNNDSNNENNNNTDQSSDPPNDTPNPPVEDDNSWWEDLFGL